MAIHVELLSPPANFAVVQLPKRRFPGVVVQGDTLHSFFKQLEHMSRLLEDKKSNELAEEIAVMKETFSDVLVDFERVCEEHGIKLPY